MHIVVSDHSERVVDIIRSWFRWLNGFLAITVTIITVAILTGLSVWVLGWSKTPAYLAIVAALAFAIGPFGETYIRARLAKLWIRHHLSGTFSAPSRRQFLLAAVIQAALIALAVIGSWLYLGHEWSLARSVGHWSPWLALLVPMTPLVFAEVSAARRIGMQIRLQARLVAATAGYGDSASEAS